MSSWGGFDILPVPGKAGDSLPHGLDFLFHWALRTRLSPWVSYTPSADLTSREPPR